MGITFYGEDKSNGRCYGVSDDEPSMQLANGNACDLLEALGLEVYASGEVAMTDLEVALERPRATPAKAHLLGYIERLTTLAQTYRRLGCTHVYWG